MLSTDARSPKFSGHRPKRDQAAAKAGFPSPARRTIRLFERCGRPGRLRQIAHRIRYLRDDRFEIIDAGKTHCAVPKLLQPRLESLGLRRLAVAHREMRPVAGL